MEEWIEETYNNITEGAKGKKVMLPYAEPSLEAEKDARKFFHELRKKMAAANAVVTVFTPGNVSAAIETTMASVSGKSIIIIAEDPDDVPRLLRGLPGVINVIGQAEFSDGTARRIEALFSPRLNVQ